MKVITFLNECKLLSTQTNFLNFKLIRYIWSKHVTVIFACSQSSVVDRIYLNSSFFFGHKLSKSFDWPENLDRTKYRSIKVAMKISIIDNQRRLSHKNSFVFAPKFLFSWWFGNKNTGIQKKVVLIPVC